MIFQEKKYTLNGREVVLRSAGPEDAQMLIDYLVTVCGETRFLLCEPEEVSYTIEQENQFIDGHNSSDGAMLILAFVDGEYAGNCSFDRRGPGRRMAHRAEIGIALFQKFTGAGLGRLLLETLLAEIRNCGFEQAELTVVSTNARARHLYESLGFSECGRVIFANKYDDGSYSDDIIMVLRF